MTPRFRRSYIAAMALIRIVRFLTGAPAMKNVLILCTGNSCRSQMAQVIWQHLGNGEWAAESAGSSPSGFVHPLALEAIEEIGLATEGLSSKSLATFIESPMGLVVTVCDHAKQACPVLPGVDKKLHWPFEDPADAAGSREEKMKAFRGVRDQIYQKISEYLNTDRSDAISD